MCRHIIYVFFFFNDTATTEIYTLSLHDALPICFGRGRSKRRPYEHTMAVAKLGGTFGAHTRTVTALVTPAVLPSLAHGRRSEEHTSELQSRQYLVCRLLLEKKKKYNYIYRYIII